MRLLDLLIASLLLASIMSLKVLKEDEISKDYPVGRLVHIDFFKDGRLFFQTKENVLGFMHVKTGKILSVYVMEKDELIIDHRGEDEIVMSKGKVITIFMPKQERLIKLQYSDFLAKQEFSKIISFKRVFEYDYILTDKFLLKARNPYNPSGEPMD